MLIQNTIPNTLNINLLTFRDTGKKFELKGDLLRRVSNKNYNVDLASLSEENYIYDFGSEMYFDGKAPANKSNRDKTLIRLLKSPSLMISASGISNTLFLLSDPNKICNRLKVLLQEKQAGNTSDIISGEIIAIVDKLLEYKCMSTKQTKILLVKCSN